MHHRARSAFIRPLSLIIIIAFWGTACASKAQVLPDSSITPTAAFTATQTPEPTSTPTPAPPTPTASPSPQPTEAPLPLSQYTLAVDFDYDQRAGRVDEQIVYVNASADTLDELRLMVELFAYPGSFALTGLWWDDGAPVENAVWENIQIRFPLRQPLAPGQSVTVRIAYEFRLPSQSSLTGSRPIPIGFTARQANLVDWYPFVPPYRSGKGWLAYPPSFYGEHLVLDLADFEVNLRLTGPENLLVAASAAPAASDPGSGELHYRHERARGFALSIGSDYQSETAQAGGVTVTSYYFTLHDQAGKHALKAAVEALELYEQIFGPYPHDTLAVVQADFLDGMEYDGLFFLSKAFYNLSNGTPADYLVAIAAHETAHQWWYGVIGSDQANEPWMDEALATYSEYLYYEHYYPEALDWWWANRINLDNPRGWVNSSVYNARGAPQSYEDYRSAVYLNGAYFLHDLRQAAGDEAFFAFLKDYTARFAGDIAFSGDFFALLAQHTQADLTPVLDRYFAK